jgi:hypothetical protein
MESPDEVCGFCLTQQGLCERHAVSVLPQLAVNLGWLRLMGEVRVEQQKRQHPTDEQTARQVKRAERREARKFARRGFTVASALSPSKTFLAAI